MAKVDLESRLAPLVKTQTDALGLTLWGLEAPAGSGRQMVRVFVEGSGEDEQGVDVDSLAKLSRALSVALDVEDVVPGAYTLEVSSPGLERRFFAPRQLPRYLGRTVTARLDDPEPISGRRKFTGKLTRAEDDRLEILDDDGQEWELAWNDIKRLHLVHEF